MARPAPLTVPRIHPQPAELVDLAGIATVLGVHRGTVDVWRHRGRAGVPFPPVDELDGRRPRWRWSSIAAWCELVAGP